jgi:hypothetical protein
MNTIIFFREGLSGHYLKLLVDDSRHAVNFRVDSWYPGIYNAPKLTVNQSCVCAHKHLVNWNKISKEFDLILTIQVRKKIYHAIYNNFYKKYLIENPQLQNDFDNWTSNLMFWYDTTYYNIKEYYDLYQQDLKENTFENIIEFDYILEPDYIEQIFLQYYNRSLTENMKNIVKTYRDLQLKYDLSGNERAMNDIVSVFPEHVFLESPWYASYCIFKYETNNGLTENQRQWSINLVTRPIDKKFLLDLSSQYQL